MGILCDLSDVATALNVNGAITFKEKTADPSAPAEGTAIIWMSDGTGYGDDGDVCIASNPDGTAKKAILFDYSAGAAWS